MDHVEELKQYSSKCGESSVLFVETQGYVQDAMRAVCDAILNVSTDILSDLEGQVKDMSLLEDHMGMIRLKIHRRTTCGLLKPSTSTPAVFKPVSVEFKPRQHNRVTDENEGSIIIDEEDYDEKRV